MALTQLPTTPWIAPAACWATSITPSSGLARKLWTV
jgi:hypothetical protein